MAEVSKLHRLRLLEERLAYADAQWMAERDAEIEREGERDRQAAILALTEVVEFCQDRGIKGGPLPMLLTELSALEEGSSPGAMFKPLPTDRRRRDPPIRDSIKGRLAAVMAYRQSRGAKREEAARWVARSLPAVLHRRMGTVTHSRLAFWLDRWGGMGGKPGPGREGFEAMQVILQSRQPTEAQLRDILGQLGDYLSAPDST